MEEFQKESHFGKRYDQGQEAEEKVAIALLKLKGIGLISDYIRADKHSQLDVAGIDFLISLNCGLAFLLQVKSSTSSVKRHYIRHPNIPCITVLPRQDRIRPIERRIMAIIRKKRKAFFSGAYPKFLK